MEREGLGWSSLLGMGISTAAIMAVGFALGWLVDTALGTSPAFLLVGLAVGIVAAVAYIVVKFREYLSPTNSPTNSNTPTVPKKP